MMGARAFDRSRDPAVPKRVHLPLLSKTRYMAGIQCDKRLYLDCHRPDLLPEVSPGQQRLFDQGHEVGALARSRYPGGVLIEYDRSQYEEAAAATALAMADPSVPAIFEPAFTYAGVRIRVDILVRLPRGCWRVEEVKSSTSFDEDVHLHDLAVQLFILDSSGVRVSEAGILHIDRDYVRATKDLDPHALFRFVELRKLARGTRRDVVQNLRRWRKQLVRLGAPDIKPGRHCYAPYECPFTEHCIKPPGRFSLRRLPAPFKVIDAIGADAPDDVRRLAEDVSLTAHQARAVECITTDHEFVGSGLESALAAASYPIHFVDFETIAPAVPRYRRTRPYQTLPFQWSDHVLHADDRVEHLEFLHTADTDPRSAFVDSLLEATARAGTIVVYTSFENTQLKALAKALRHRRKRIRKVQRRLFDLFAVVKEHYYHADLDGSFSLKTLAPVLVPALEYGEIADGRAAGAAYEEMIRSSTGGERRASLEASLRQYCRTDTLAMLEIWKALDRRAADAG
jgi:hypothetical protein